MNLNTKEYNSKIAAAKQLHKELQSYNPADEKQAKRIETLLNTNSELVTLAHNLSQEEKVREAIEQLNAASESKERDMAKFVKVVNSNKRKKQTRRIMLTTVGSIAAAVLFLSFWLLGDKLNDRSNRIVAPNTQVAQLNIMTPTLITDHGDYIDLSRAQKIDKLADNLLQEVTKESATYTSGSIKDDSLVFNSIVVPNMFTYELTLSDGSRVTVSANSKLTYPVAFNSDKRVVELNGMAFFDVAKSDKPFIVKVNGTEVNVYGTRFNVNGYNPMKTKTTLVSGSVGVKYPVGDEFNEVMIKPNEELTINVLAGESSVNNNANVDKHLAWLDGFFRADSEPITNLLLEVSNWYGVRFTYKPEEINQIMVSASIIRETPIDTLLEIITKSTNLKFRKEDNIYRVSTK